MRMRVCDYRSLSSLTHSLLLNYYVRKELGVYSKKSTTAALGNDNLAALKELQQLLTRAHCNTKAVANPDFPHIKQQLIKAFAEAWHAPRERTRPTATAATASCYRTTATHTVPSIVLLYPDLLQQSRAAQQRAIQDMGSSSSVLTKLWNYIPLTGGQATQNNTTSEPKGEEERSPMDILKEAARRGGVTWTGLVRGYGINGENILQSGWFDPHLLAAYGIGAAELKQSVPGFGSQTLINATPNVEELLALGLNAEMLVSLFSWTRYQLPALWISSSDWIHRLGLTKAILSQRMNLDRATAVNHLFHPGRPEHYRWRLEDLVFMGYTEQELVVLGLVQPSPLPPQPTPQYQQQQHSLENIQWEI